MSTTRLFQSSLAAAVLCLVSHASAKPLSSSDLQQMGVTGVYRGTATGTAFKWDGVPYMGAENINYIQSQISTTVRVTVPYSRRTKFTGPSGNQFTMLASASGGKRRVKIVALYSGSSFNSEFGNTTVASGGQTVVMGRKGTLQRPRWVIQYSDAYFERLQVGGDTLQFMSFGGTLTKN